MKEYNIILKQKPLDEGITLAELTEMYGMLSGVDALPLDIQGEHSAAIGIINLFDAELMDYDLSSLERFIKEILDDMEKESPDGIYEIDNGHGVSSIHMYR